MKNTCNDIAWIIFCILLYVCDLAMCVAAPTTPLRVSWFLLGFVPLWTIRIHVQKMRQS